MKKIYLFIVSIILFIFFIPSTHALNAKNFANKISNYIDTRVQVTDRFPVYDKVRNRISEVIIKIDRSETQKRQFFKDLAFYHNNNILKLVSYITSRQGATDRFREWKQENIDILLQEQKKINTGTREIIYINSKNEITKDNDIYKLIYEDFDEVKYLPGMPDNNLFYKDGIGLIVISEYELERKIPFAEIIQEGASKFFLYSSSFFEKDNYFYTYAYDKYYNVNSNYGVYKSEIERSGFSYDDAVFLRLQDRKNNVTFSPTKVPMTSRSYFEQYGDSQKEFLNSSVIDLLRSSKDYSKTYKNIIDLAYRLTDGKESDDEKTHAIYDWMVKNIVYPKTYSLDDFQIFSGFEAYENKSAVCEGQARLMYYLLKIAGVQDVQYIDGYVVDADDFPEVGHAWIQVGDYFYDPSFEKIYRQDTKKYLYYKIPYDLAYTNRYNSRDLPEQLKQTEKQSIYEEINRRRHLLTERYDISDGYELLKKAHFMKKYNIPVNTPINLNTIIDILPTYELYLENGTTVKTHPSLQKKVSYFPMSDLNDNIEAILGEIDYDISGYAIIKRYENGEFIGYGITDSLIE